MCVNKRMAFRIAASVVFAAVMFGQTAPPIPQDLAFEVASLKPSKPGQVGGIIRPLPGGRRYEALNVPIRLMLQVAYRLQPDQIINAPGWLDNESFDMEAQAERPANGDELHVMLINLLVERLHLKFHREQKDMPVYAMFVDKSGIKMTPHSADNAGQIWVDAVVNGEHAQLKATVAPMNYFAFRLSQFLDRPVIDHTGLEGGYDFSVEFAPRLDTDPNAADITLPNVFMALKQQLGLELKAQRGAAEVLVIDHVEKPTVE
jgi:uncharacterized protein (TIGR03435 family)